MALKFDTDCRRGNAHGNEMQCKRHLLDQLWTGHVDGIVEHAQQVSTKQCPVELMLSAVDGVIELRTRRFDVELQQHANDVLQRHVRI